MQFHLQKTPLWLDVERIFNSNSKIPVFRYEAQLHTDEEDLDIMQILSIDYSRDYIKKVGDEIQFKFHMPFGEYVHRFYPKRHNLEVTLKRIKLGGSGYYTDLMTLHDVERYKAIFIPHMNQHVSLKVANTVDEFTLNNQAPVEVTLQLLNRTLEPLRIKTLQGIFTDVDREDLIRGILGGESAKILIDGRPGIDAIDIVKPNNQEPIKQVIFPNNTPVLSIPTFLQERHTGVYAGGIGNYFQTYKNQRTWFVYPIFDITRFDEPVEKLIVYSVPGQQYVGMDRTYLVDDKTIHIVGTGEQRYMDDGESSQMNDGVGFRQADASFFLDKPVKMTKDGPVGIRKKINTEVVLKERDDNLTYAGVANLSIGVNKFSQYSRHLINNGARVDVIWHNSDNALIYPGMPCKYVYMTESEIKEVKGIVVANHTLVTTGNMTTGVKKTDQKYSVTTNLVLFVEKFTNVEE